MKRDDINVETKVIEAPSNYVGDLFKLNGNTIYLDDRISY